MIPLALFLYNQGSQFDQTHLLTIAICLICFILIPFFGQKLSKEHQYIAMVGILTIGILQEIIDYSNRIVMRDLNWVEDLPFHICNYVFYIGLVSVWTKKQFLFEVTYLLGMGAAFITILTPEFKMLNVIDYIAFFVSHALIVVFALWGIFIDGMRPRKYSVLKVYSFLWIMVLPVGLICWITGGNYMLLMEPPEVTNPLVFGEWPWYIINISIIGLILMCLTYTPFLIVKTESK